MTADTLPLGINKTIRKIGTSKLGIELLVLGFIPSKVITLEQKMDDNYIVRLGKSTFALNQKYLQQIWI